MMTIYFPAERRFLRALFLFVLSFFGLPSFAEAQEDLASVESLLNQASRALQQKDYKGRFTYEFGNILESLEIVHSVKDGVEYERIQHLNGNAREFLRSGRSSGCITVGNQLLRGGLINTRAGVVSLAQNYHFYIRGDDRIAGKEAAVVQAVPKDEFRYGMTLAVDKDSKLPLMSLITASSKQALERFQFVQLEVGGEIETSDLEPKSSIHKDLDGSALCNSQFPASGQWSVSWVPPGFILTEAGRTDTDEEVFTFTDGLASFSIFISKVSNGGELKKGLARRGATVALLAGLALDQFGYSVVFVGEVPIATAKGVIASLQFRALE